MTTEMFGDENTSGPDDIAAMGAIVKALRPFKEDERQRIVDSALTLLGGAKRPRDTSAAVVPREAPPEGGQPEGKSDSAPPPPRDVRAFRDEKQPRTGIEMAAVTAYYLWKLAPTEMRKDFITSSDVTKLFGQAGFLQPGDPLMTLVNGKNAGYFDSLGDGKYRLNPVGQNLVTHGLPKKGEGAASPRSRPRRKSRGKPSKQAPRKNR